MNGGKFNIYEGGEIVFIRNITFKNKYADHASLNGRPCVVISEFNNKLTLLPLASSIPKNTSDKSQTIFIKKEDIDIEKKCFKPKEKEYVNLGSMFQQELRFYDVVALVKFRRYLRLLEEIELKRLENNPICSEYYKEIYQDLEYQRNKMELTLRRR